MDINKRIVIGNESEMILMFLLVVLLVNFMGVHADVSHHEDIITVCVSFFFF